MEFNKQGAFLQQYTTCKKYIFGYEILIYLHSSEKFPEKIDGRYEFMHHFYQQFGCYLKSSGTLQKFTEKLKTEFGKGSLR